jgi:hypothetical protein
MLQAHVAVKRIEDFLDEEEGKEVLDMADDSS